MALESEPTRSEAPSLEIAAMDSSGFDDQPHGGPAAELSDKHKSKSPPEAWIGLRRLHRSHAPETGHSRLVCTAPMLPQ